jgi:hypothetical protein
MPTQDVESAHMIAFFLLRHSSPDDAGVVGKLDTFGSQFCPCLYPVMAVKDRALLLARTREGVRQYPNGY